MSEPKGLTDRQKASMEALLPVMLGIPSGEKAQVKTAVERLDAYIRSIPEEGGRSRVKQLMFFVNLKCFVETRRFPASLSSDEREEFVKRLFDSDGTAFDAVADFATELFGDVVPSVRDLAKSVREMYSLAYYTNPDTDSVTGYTPVWKRDDIWDRADVGRASNPGAQPATLDVAAIRKRHGLDVEVPRDFDPWPEGKGKRVAVIGSGAGGAVVAAHLAAQGHRVAVFESGPRFKPSEYPLDALAGMSLLFEDGLTTLNHNLDVHLLRGRVVGGSTVLTSGMSIKLRTKTRDHWIADGLGLGAKEIDDAFTSVEKRLRLGELNPDLVCDPGELWKKGGDKLNTVAGQVIYDFSVPVANVMTKRNQHDAQNLPPDKVGDFCLACGLCNYGCHFGHKLSTDLTYLLDAEKTQNAKIHPNTPVDHLVAERAPNGDAKITALVLQRSKQRIEVDHVVLAAGAVGSPALLLRSARKSGVLRDLPSMRNELVGKYLGFNYGTTVVARWAHKLAKPGDAGIQINYVATKSGDDHYVLENAFIPPGLIANVVPGIGADHRRFMESYRHLGMCVNTIGSPQHGRVEITSSGEKVVRYRVSPAEMDTIRRTLATIVRMYLSAGACEVGLAGIRRVHDKDARFDSTWRDVPEWRIVEHLEQALPDAEHVMLSSAHPQGGMRMHENEDLGVVSRDFNVHGTSNLFVADASLFPSTIVVNPQWSVMAFGQVGAEKIHAMIEKAV